MVFKENEYPTVGIEQEFHLVAADTADLVSACDPVMSGLQGRLRKAACHELFLSVMEIRSPVMRGVAELYDNICEDRRTAADSAEAAGVRLVAGGSHPFARWQDQEFVASPHYQWVKREHGYLVNRMLAYGLHVHVGMQNGDAALYAMSEFRRWLYPLLGFSANSPFYEGCDTGLASTRTHLFHGLPRTHLPPEFRSISEYADLFKRLKAAGDVRQPGELWWTIRPQPTLGTVEIRAFDLSTDARRVAVLAAVVQACLATYQDRFREGVPLSHLKRVYLEENEWKAMRYGLDATVLDPETGELVSMRDQLRRLLQFIAPKAEELGSADFLNLARDLVQQDTEAQWQRQRLRELDGDFRALELELAGRTVA